MASNWGTSKKTLLGPPTGGEIGGLRGTRGGSPRSQPQGNPWKPGPRADAAKKKHTRQFDQELGRMDAEASAKKKGILPSDLYDSMHYWKGKSGGGGL